MNEVDYRAIQQRVILRWLNRLLFVAHFLCFLAITTYLETRRVISPNTSMLWFSVLVAHFLWAFNTVGTFIQRQTEREAARLRARGYTVIAPKRDRTLAGEEKPKRAARLRDDGEIEFDDEPRELDEVNAARRLHTEN